MRRLYDIVRENFAVCAALGVAVFVASPNNASAAPDLVVTSLSANVSGYAVTYTAQVKNTGADASGPVSIDIFRNTDPGATAPASGYPTSDVAGLAPGAVANVQFPPVYYQNGTYSAYAWIDSTSAVSETVETNNTFGPISVKVAATPATGADLMIVGVVAAPQQDGSLKYDVTVFNGGTEAVAGAPIGSGGKVARLQIFFDSNTAPPFLLPKGDSNFDFFDGLAPGSFKTIKFYWKTPAAKLTTAWCIIDSGQAIQETNENNNMYGPLYVDLGVDTPLNDPDLVIENFEATVQGMSISYQVDIRNSGEKSATAFTVAVVHSSEGTPNFGTVASDNKTTVFVGNGLAPGETQSLKLFWPQATVGSHKAWAMVDSTNAVVESDENNNAAGPEASTVVTIAGPDLLVTDFNVDVADNTVIYTGFVKNVGDQATGSFDVDVIRDSGVTPTWTGHGDQFKTLPGLNPGASVSVSFTWNDVPDGTYSSWIKADTMNTVAESSESNNTAGPKTFSVGESGPIDDPVGPDNECKNTAFIQAPCKCGTLTVQSGYCCDTVWRVLPCDIVIDEPDIDQEPLETDVEGFSSDDSSGSDGIGSVDPSSQPSSTDDDEDDSGCRAGNDFSTPHRGILLFLIIAFAISIRNPTRRFTAVK
ncbi:MAG: hypothetical protein HUU55_13605 [Myxococcales bacterium]|nr:hypothetical protein [Myxococcales bacterium]